MGIVPTFDEFEDCLACLGLVVEGRAIKQFTFQGDEETLAEGIIETIVDRAHRRKDPGSSTALAKRQGSVLTALVRMMDDTFWVALLDRHLHGIHHQGRLEVRGHCPANICDPREVRRHPPVRHECAAHYRCLGDFEFLMDFMDPFAQLLIRLRSFRRWSLAPGVIATGRDMQHTTDGFHRIESLVRTHEFEDFGGTASDSRANQARLSP